MGIPKPVKAVASPIKQDDRRGRERGGAGQMTKIDKIVVDAILEQLCPFHFDGIPVLVYGVSRLRIHATAE